MSELKQVGTVGKALLAAQAAHQVGVSAAKREASKADPRMHGRGAKKSKVPAVAGADALRKEADKEAHSIFEHKVGRIQHWLKVGESCRSQPDLLAQYPDYLRDALFKMAKLPIPTPLSPLSKWTDERAISIAKGLNVEVSQCRRAMKALSTQFTATVKVLEGKGTFAQKIALLPKASNAGRTRSPDASGQSGRKSKGKKDQASDEAMTPIQRASNAVAQMTMAELTRVLHFVSVQLQERGNAPEKALASDVLKALDTYDKAPTYQETKVKQA